MVTASKMSKRPLSEKELQEIAANLSDCENDDDIANNLNDDSESDCESDHTFIASENEVHDEQEVDENDNAVAANVTAAQMFVAKDGTQWSSVPNPTSLTRGRNIIKSPLHRVCLPPGKVLEEPVESFMLYINDDIISEIVKCTNEEALRVFPNEWKATDFTEMYAFFGLLITAGHLKANFTSYDILWNAVYGPPIFRATMSIKRFKLLLRFIRFDDKSTRSERRRNDKLAPIRNIFEKINKNLTKHYLPGDNITVDEQLVPFRGRCPFKQYMPAKPDKYGMKIWWVCDSSTYYPLKGIPYTGRKKCVFLSILVLFYTSCFTGKEGNKVTKGLASQVVLSLTEPYFPSNRNVTFDNYFTDLNLSSTLLVSGLTSIGTVRKNKQFIPNEFQPSKSRQEYTSIFGFTKNAALVSYVPKPRKAVILLSTMHSFATVDEDNKRKPEIILKYNETKCGVDTLDQLVHEYMCKRRTNRWPFAFFMNLLDVVGVAAYVVWCNLYPDWNNGKHERRRIFLVFLAESLIKPHMQQRNIHRLPQAVRQAVNIFYPPNSNREDEVSVVPPKKRRCNICPKQKSRNQKQVCDICTKNVCNEHSKVKRICKNCINN